MRPVLATLGRSTLALGLGALLVACPTPQNPKGPPPEYEEPAAPSWLDGGASAEASSPSSVAPLPAAGAVPPKHNLP